MVAGEVDAGVAQEAMDDLDLVRQPGDALAGGRELEAVRLVLPLHPAGADPERDAAAGDLVGSRRRAGQHRRMAEGDGGDERAELERRRPRGEPRDRGPGVEHRPALVESGDVVVGAKQCLDAVGLAGLRERDPVVPGDAFLSLDHQRHPRGRGPYRRDTCGRNVTLLPHLGLTHPNGPWRERTIAASPEAFRPALSPVNEAAHSCHIWV